MKSKMILTVTALLLALAVTPGLVAAGEGTENSSTSAPLQPAPAGTAEPAQPESLTIDPVMSQGTNYAMAKVDSNAVDSNSTAASTEIFAPALDGHSLISFNTASTRHFFFGTDQSFLYDTRVQDQAGASSGALQTSPYFGFANRTESHYYALQYSGSFTNYTNSNLDSMYLNRVSATGGGNIGRAWSWKFNSTMVQGDDQLLLTSALPTTVGTGNTLEGTAMPALYGTARSIAGVDTAATLNWQESRRSTVSFSGSDSYYSFLDTGIDNHIAGLNVAYERTMSLHSTMKAYGESFHTFGTDCTSAGAGLGYAVELGSSTTIEAEGGPQFSSTVCGNPQTFNARVGVTRTIFENGKAYLNASRDHGSAYLENAFWEDVMSAGYAQSFKKQYVLESNFGWVQSRLAHASANYRGLFTAVSVRRQFNRELAAVASYRYFTHAYAGDGWNRNIGMFTLEWTPSRGNAQ